MYGTANARHCREAFNVVVLFWVFCGVILLLTVLTVKRDEEEVQRRVSTSTLLWRYYHQFVLFLGARLLFKTLSTTHCEGMLTYALLWCQSNLGARRYSCP
jgi:hypothetical protein